jgi:hypothetical protein
MTFSWRATGYMRDLAQKTLQPRLLPDPALV